MKIAVALLLMAIRPPVEAVRLQPDGSCPVMTLIPFTDAREGKQAGLYGSGQWPNASSLGKAAFSLMAAAEMAKEHFNSRDSSIVPELADLGTCNITLSEGLFRDSAYDRRTAVDHVLDTVSADRNALCAVIGPIEPRSCEGVSALTENLEIPQVAFATIDRRLSRQEDFPNFARMIPEAKYFAETIAYYVQRDILKRDFVGVIYDASDYGEQFENPLEDAEDELVYWTTTEHIVEGSRSSIEDALGDVKKKGYHTIVLVTNKPHELEEVANVAKDLGLLGDEYLWIISGPLLPPQLLSSISYQVDSAADKLLRGAALFTNFDPFVYVEGDTFLNSWRSQKDDMVERLNQLHPLAFDHPAHFVGKAGYFQEETPTEYASFLYDAITATGISACKASKNQESHVKELRNSQFNGASGSIRFQEDENGRNRDGVIFGMYNVRPGETDKNGRRSYEVVLTARYSDEYTYTTDDGTQVDGAWIRVNGTEFIFHDGTTNPPMPLKTTIEYNYLSKHIQIVGFCLVGIALLIIVGSATWVFALRKESLVKASQPEFLYKLCFGAALVSSSLLFISFDEDKGWSEEKLDSACAAFPWFFVLGYLIMYCALYCKLWRLSKLLTMRRQVVRMEQVLLPFIVIISCSIIVLIVWQAVAPLQWVREDVGDDPEMPRETYGECQSSNAIPFIVSIAVFFGLTIAMTGYIAWKLKDVQEELSESKWIFTGIFVHAEIWCIGIPLYFILDDVSKDASYLISAVLTFVFSTSLVVAVIWPKIYRWVRDKYFGGPAKERTRISVAGGGSTHISGLSNISSNDSSGQGGKAQHVARISELEREVASLRMIIDKAPSSRSSLKEELPIIESVDEEVADPEDSGPEPHKIDPAEKDVDPEDPGPERRPSI